MAVKKITGLQVEVKGDTTNFKKAMREIEKDVNTTNTSLKKLNKSLKLDPTDTELLRQKQLLLKEAVNDTTKEINEFKNIQKQLDSKGVDKLSNEYQELNYKITSAEESLKNLKKQQIELGSVNLNSWSTSLDNVSTKLDKIADKTKVASQAAIGLLVGSTYSAIQYESEIADIEKITGKLSDETVKNLKNIAIETGSAFSNVSEFATIGAALGIAEADLSSFTKTLKDLETVTNGTITGEEGGKMVARFLNVMGIGTDQVSNFGSALTIVEDSLAVTADEVLEMASRLAGLKQIGNITAHDLIGLGSEMKNLGLATESSSSAISRTFLQIESAVATGSDMMAEYARVAGMSAEEFAEAWESEPMEAFIKFTDGIKGSVFLEIDEAVANSSAKIEEFAAVASMSADQFAQAWKADKNSAFEKYVNGMQQLGDEAESSAVILKELELNNIRTAETLLKLAGNGDVVRETIELSNKAWNENTALTEKANRIYETTEYQLKGTWEQIKQTAASFGDFLLPAVQDSVEVISDFAKTLEELPDGTKKAIGKLALFTAALYPTAKAGAAATKALSNVTSMMSKLIGVTDNAGESISKSGGFISGLSNIVKLLGPVGIAGVTITASAGIGVLIGSLANANDSLYQIGKNIDETKNKLAEAKESAAANYLNELVDVAIADRQMESLYSLITAIKNTQVGTEEYNVALEDLQQQLNTINTTLGTNWAWSAEQQNIVNTKNEVVALQDEYKKLRDEMIKNSWIEANKTAYEEAIKAQNEYSQNANEIFEEMKKTISEAPASLQELWNKYGTEMFNTSEYSNLVKNQEEGISSFTASIVTAKQELDELNQTYVDNESFINMFEQVQSISGETFSMLQQMGNIELVTADQTTQISTLREEIDKMNEDIASMEEMNTNGIFDIVIQDKKEQLANLEEQLTLLQETANIAQENAKINAEGIATTATEAIVGIATQGASDTEETFTTSLGNVATEVTSTFATAGNAAKESIAIGTNAWDLWQPQVKDLYANIHYQVVSGQEYASPFAFSYGSPSTYSVQPMMARKFDSVERAITPLDLYEDTLNNISSTNLQKLRRTADNISNTFDNAKESNDIKKFEELLEKLQIQIVVNNDMDGREISSRISTIQGLKLKKQSS